MKKLLLTSLCALGVHRFAAWWNRNRVIILCYHGITENANRYPGRNVGQDVYRDNFAEHLGYLQRHYGIISLDEYVAACRARKPLPPYTVVVTFDDGFLNFATVAAPLLSKRGVPSTVFVITDTLKASENGTHKGSAALSDDERFLSWKEVSELEQNQLVKIGSHTCSHPHLFSISADEVARELSESRIAIKNQLQSEGIAFAYPYGGFTASLAEQARAEGYHCALTIEGGPNDIDSDLYSLRRNVISHEDQGLLFAARVSCLTWWLSKLQDKLKAGGRSLTALFNAEPSPIVRLLNDVPSKEDTSRG
ncbi:MAG TPA: polysaccharide deacetylase family protein [Pyrinomonadaceae bacterium]|jgi:peptidoglycan/xylan/chitin deacetylase (PgdA/CDA1 family)|nr:polysaccharide deacetylase family protein [Pyrinomonadaceae bacterium]